MRSHPAAGSATRMPIVVRAFGLHAAVSRCSEPGEEAGAGTARLPRLALDLAVHYGGHGLALRRARVPAAPPLNSDQLLCRPTWVCITAKQDESGARLHSASDETRLRSRAPNINGGDCNVHEPLQVCPRTKNRLLKPRCSVPPQRRLSLRDALARQAACRRMTRLLGYVHKDASPIGD